MDVLAPTPYTLIATMGLAPAVVTEVIWKLANDPDAPRLPEKLTILTTAEGFAKWQTDMVDGGIWSAFCSDVLNGKSIEVDLKVPSRNNVLMADVQNAEDDLLLANLIYGLVFEHTRPGLRPVVGSLAGGRKTMSAHMMAAFTAYARPSDKLVHVLVPVDLERDKSFYYPLPGTPPPTIHCVNIPFAPLYGYLKRGIFGKIDKNERDLNALIEAVKTYYYAPLEHVRCHIGNASRSTSTLSYTDAEGQEQLILKLSLQNLATFLVLAQQLNFCNNHLQNDQLITDSARQQYRAVAGLLGKHLTPWQDTEDVTNAVSRLKVSLKTSAMAQEYLTISGRRLPQYTLYSWEHRKPPHIELVGDSSVIQRANKAKWRTLFPDFPIRPAKARHAPD